MNEFLFTYGTLRDPSKFEELGVAVRHVGPATTKGLLYDCGAYPAAVLTPNGKIVGEVYELLSGDALEKLDGYEGVAAGLYQRRLVKTTKGVTVYMYVQDGEDAGRHSLIPSGDWHVRD